MSDSIAVFLETVCQGAIAAAVFGFVGILLMILGFRLFDMATSFDLNKELAEDNNMAVSILMSAVVLATALVVAAAIS